MMRMLFVAAVALSISAGAAMAQTNADDHTTAHDDSLTSMIAVAAKTNESFVEVKRACSVLETHGATIRRELLLKVTITAAAESIGSPIYGSSFIISGLGDTVTYDRAATNCRKAFGATTLETNVPF